MNNTYKTGLTKILRHFAEMIIPPIPDDTAMKFSLALYERLNSGRSIGEALQSLREENPRDPTFRAFAYFGDPWARPHFAKE